LGQRERSGMKTKFRERSLAGKPEPE
jgi:hypothetical protein